MIWIEHGSKKDEHNTLNVFDPLDSSFCCSFFPGTPALIHGPSFSTATLD